MKLTLHTCCGPCAIYPVRVLRDEGVDVMGFFYRSNIHPWAECQRREEALRTYAEKVDLKVVFQKGYDMENFFRNTAFRESVRCLYCHRDRLYQTARIAKKGKFDAFSSTLLYSKFQDHDQIKSIGEVVAKETGVPFYYRDFRPGWKEGIEKSREMGLYRQQYCGCLHSEKERYLSKIRRAGKNGLLFNNHLS
ncbi:Epoxyqueuosine reductase QueH [Candidatus Desulfarcum epimagneticum]|uniref:Epoxyqueuosine reductase QueH n=1 Tax=uncultured Desulfobacteraceae bacterium TaxID=218296 RepID=A0A484HII0_9BACT|nr:Epoxyqueuosine reductase QueH [uncultured Desulfobacteraceae bacterium]